MDRTWWQHLQITWISLLACALVYRSTPQRLQMRKLERVKYSLALLTRQHRLKYGPEIPLRAPLQLVHQLYAKEPCGS